MILLAFIGLLIPLSGARFINSPLVHLSDTLKIKCDALPYRTAYIGTRCYFAVTNEVDTDAPTSVFRAMMFERSKFHVGTDSSGKAFKSSGAKQSICMFESGYKCDVGEQSSIIPGKCVDYSDEKKDFHKALMHCDRQGMEMPSVANELENKMIRGAIRTHDVWVRNAYYIFVEWKWHRKTYFSKFSTCWRPNYLLAGAEIQKACNTGQSSVIDKTGHWGNSWEKAEWATICVKNADNEFTRGKPPCAANHKTDDEGNCEWTGPDNACAQIIDFYNRTWFFPMPDFPKTTFRETTDCPLNDVATKVIVRRGCMFSGYRHPRNGDGSQELPSVLYRTYGAWNIPCQLTGELTDIYDGISREQCFCDPTEATINGHEPAPPPKKKCIEHHVFDETTQSCEWKHEAKFCAELITNDGRTKMLEIPNWPNNRKYDVNHWENVTEIIVRQHCWATLYWWDYHSALTLPTSGYGKHVVGSYYNSLRSHPDHGTHRVVCECIR